MSPRTDLVTERPKWCSSLDHSIEREVSSSSGSSYFLSSSGSIQYNSSRELPRSIRRRCSIAYTCSTPSNTHFSPCLLVVPQFNEFPPSLLVDRLDIWLPTMTVIDETCVFHVTKSTFPTGLLVFAGWAHCLLVLSSLGCKLYHENRHDIAMNEGAGLLSGSTVVSYIQLNNDCSIIHACPVSCSQMYYYYTRYTSDAWHIKMLVSTIMNLQQGSAR